MTKDIRELKIMILENRLLILKDEDEKKKTELKIEALRKGYKFYYEEELADEKTEEFVDFVFDVMQMYSVMHNSISNNQKPPYTTSLKDVKFQGFDGNNESDYRSLVLFLISNNRFVELMENPKDDFNSHCKMLNHYKKMLEAYNSMSKPIFLSDEEIKKLLSI